ncbi:hypothetical protein DEA98_29345 (plasmid) [Brucella pseudogrignonensis]|nr:hypothetical protein [Brucella pseudogrignonensis]
MQSDGGLRKRSGLKRYRILADNNAFLRDSGILGIADLFSLAAAAPSGFGLRRILIAMKAINVPDMTILLMKMSPSG